MNFLAHVYLSYEDPELTIGNFIADAIKGKKYTHFSTRIQQGIILHRKIDYFTDTHSTVRKSIARLFPKYRHYSGVIVDIIYDHFLAANWDTYSTVSLEAYAQSFYTLLEDNYSILPNQIQRFLPYMIKDNWLFNYASMQGISTTLYGMNERTNNKSKMNFAVLDLEAHYQDFEKEFHSFFEELIMFVKQEERLL